MTIQAYNCQQDQINNLDLTISIQMKVSDWRAVHDQLEKDIMTTTGAGWSPTVDLRNEIHHAVSHVMKLQKGLIPDLPEEENDSELGGRQ